MQYGFVIDHRRCIGCHACTVACKSENEVPVGNFRTWVKYTEIGTFPQVRRHFAVLRCNHCTAAPCVTICPVTALDKRPDGIVDLDKDVCIGCKACMQACPYDALYLNEDTGGAEKCHYCAHRVEQGLEPACVVVCPEQAIIAGDLHDPNSKIAQHARMPEAVARRPEQGTGPNVWYLGMDPVSLQPGTAREPETYLWSERAEAPPPWPESHTTYPNATTTLDVHHPVLWGWKVSAYLVTKGIAAGAAMLAPFLPWLGAGALAPDTFVRAYLPELLGIVFVTVTTALLVMDLKRPAKFFSLLLRPNTRSWLVKGAWVLISFSGVVSAALAARFLGFDAIADTLRWVALPLGAAVAAYTAFLFAQCEGRDLWQRTSHLLPHLLAQAAMLGALALLPAVPSLALSVVAIVGAAAHLWLGLGERSGPHDTANARQAASLLDRIPVWKGARGSAFHTGLVLSSIAAVAAVVVVAIGVASTPLLAACFSTACIGLFFYEQAYVRAAQLPPLS